MKHPERLWMALVLCCGLFFAFTLPQNADADGTGMEMAACSEQHAVQTALHHPDVEACLDGAPCGPGYATDAYAEPNGCGWTVTISCGPNCLPNQSPCPSGPTYLVATVEIDCNCDVTSVTCYF